MKSSQAFTTTESQIITTEELISITRGFTYLHTTIRGKQNDSLWQHYAPTQWKGKEVIEVLFSSVDRDFFLRDIALYFRRYNASGLSLRTDGLEIRRLIDTDIPIIVMSDSNGSSYEIRCFDHLSRRKEPPQSLTFLDEAITIYDIMKFNDPKYFDFELSYGKDDEILDVVDLHRMNLGGRLEHDILIFMEKYLCGGRESFLESRTLCFSKKRLGSGNVEMHIGLYGLERKEIMHKIEI